jgi:DNA polymerase III subunit delta
MDIEAFEKGIKEKVKPVYALVSDQSFLREMVVDVIREHAVTGGFAKLNVSTFYADERGAIDKAIEESLQLPMMSSRRLVIVKHGESIKKKPELERLAQYLSKPPDTTCLVLCFAKLAKNTKIWKRSGKHGEAIDFGRIYERQMGPWIKRMALMQEKKIGPTAIAFLSRAVGADLTKAASEIEKAALFGGDKDEITTEHLEAVLASVKVESVFDLTDVIGGRDRAGALFLLKKMFDAGDKPISLLWQVSNHLKRLMLVRFLLTTGAGPDKVGRALGVMDFVRDKLIKQSRQFSRRELRRALVLAAQTDFELKNGRVSDRAVFEKLVLDLCEHEVQARA